MGRDYIFVRGLFERPKKINVGTSNNWAAIRLHAQCSTAGSPNRSYDMTNAYIFIERRYNTYIIQYTVFGILHAIVRRGVVRLPYDPNQKRNVVRT